MELALYDTKYARFIIICIKYFIKLCKPYLKALTSHAKDGNTTLRRLLTTSPAPLSVSYLDGILAGRLLTRMNKAGAESSFPSMDISTATFNVS